jgi:hypothetical protein
MEGLPQPKSLPSVERESEVAPAAASATAVRASGDLHPDSI